MTYGAGDSDSSHGASTDAESRQDFQSSITLPSPPGFSSEGITDLPTRPTSPTCSSPQTLATLKREAMKEKSKASKRTHATNKSRGRPTPRRRIG